MTESTSTVPYKQLTRDERKACWKVRDALFDCLEAHQESPKFTEIPKACEATYKQYEAACPPAWTEYFVKKRALDKQAALRLEMMKRLEQ
ncbi:hypothetical protein IWQ60_001943 [Tieghemiomyces parasiticus]|uniref:Uncharacterized protein n=1 Tax=Tieghemiomyces parasiticus TaxID=78921 RepID=A0A9W8AKB7_9FUNG|nr:hypothetical protein IWQ60_008634 [Tieghemiomyces parasiticus]KAJ1928568.1 hypothetical protein IWQ60_001943 [Tieghemiomyces parasiticus]